MGKGYDEKCGELARYFLAEYGYSPQSEASLAQDIQDQIERWFETPIGIKPKEITPLTPAPSTLLRAGEEE